MDVQTIIDWDNHLGMSPFHLRERILRVFNLYAEGRGLVRLGIVDLEYWVVQRQFSIVVTVGPNLGKAFVMTWGPYEAFVKIAQFDIIKDHVLPVLDRVLVLDDLSEV